MLHKTLLCSVCAAAFIALTACGGSSGGNGGAVAVVPPPPTNSAPTANVTVDKAAVEEGQPFTLDGSGSSDAEGDSLTYTWTQISGPALDGSFESNVSINLTAPEVTETGPATFQLQVSDGNLSDSTRIDVNFTNISQTPKAAVELAETSVISAGQNVRFVLTAGDEFRDFAEVGADGEVDFFQVSNVDTDIPIRQTGSDTTVTISPEASFFEGFGTVRVVDFPFLAADEAANKVDVVKRPNFNADALYQSGGQFSIDAPCAIEPVNANQLVVGQRGMGLKLVTLQYENVDQFGDGEVVGAMIEQSFSDGEAYCGFGSNYSRNLLAVDTVGMSVSLFDILDEPDPSNEKRLSFSQTISLDLPVGVENLEIVGTYDTGQGVLILVTDGQHEGSHHLIYVIIEDEAILAEGVLQKRYSWSKGVPSSLELTDLVPGNRGEGVVITSSTSPEAIVFERPNGSFADLAGPQYLEIGLGAKDIVTAKALREDNDFGLLVTYPEKGEIRVLRPR